MNDRLDEDQLDEDSVNHWLDTWLLADWLDDDSEKSDTSFRTAFLDRCDFPEERCLYRIDGHCVFDEECLACSFDPTLDEFINSQRRTWRERAAKRRKLLKQNGGDGFTKQDRVYLFDLQEGRCFYCNSLLEDRETIDHFIPVTRGGRDEIDNIVLACRGCNSSKQDKLLHEWLKIEYANEILDREALREHGFRGFSRSWLDEEESPDQQANQNRSKILELCSQVELPRLGQYRSLAFPLSHWGNITRHTETFFHDGGVIDTHDS